ncbi:MAG: hypothetical protein K2X99_03735 [Gemmatimonadaceae bacterium]|nr:hypothetical protein [Gemmatimonadaceae bacterium]
MATPRDALRFPCQRVLLARTRLAYVHLRNLLTDAKRDRAARVFGYVGIWLPDEFLLLYLQEGEVVNATATTDALRWRAIPISEALGRVPAAAEYGEICFHEADDEQLAAMHADQVSDTPQPAPDTQWADPAHVLGALAAVMHDGLLALDEGGAQHYVMLRMGAPVRGFFVDDAAATAEFRVRDLLSRRGAALRPRLYGVPRSLPQQAPPALIAMYREMSAALVHRLTALGVPEAPLLAEQTRQYLAPRYPVLERFSLSVPNPRDPVTDAPTLSAAMGAWLSGVVAGQGAAAATIVRDLTRDRRHVLQSTGFFDALPWKLQW